MIIITITVIHTIVTSAIITGTKALNVTLQPIRSPIPACCCMRIHDHLSSILFGDTMVPNIG